MVEGSALLLELVETSVLLLLLLRIEAESEAEARDTIFMPVVVLVLAGIKSVVWPWLLGIEIR